MTPPRPPLTPPETLVSSAQPEDQQDDSVSTYFAQVLEIVPNVLPDHAIALITEYLPAHQNNVVEVVLHNLFDNPGYPKLDKKGKRKATETVNADNNKKIRVELDYGSTDRDRKGGMHYTSLAIDQLMLDFPEIPKAHIRKTFGSNKSFYAPTYLFLVAEKNNGARLPYAPKKRYTRQSDIKGKGIALADPEFEAEREWLVRKLVEDEVGNDGVLAEKLNDQEYEENGDGVECGCCFSTYAFDKMVQCEDGHLFCTECMTSYAENLLGSHNVSIICMDQSGCKMPFPVSELRRFLPDKLMDLYERVKQSKEIEMAGLEGLEECPYCEYKCVIENPDEKLFRCGNLDSCGAITCRQCKKLASNASQGFSDHLPKSCKEMEEDKHLDGRHAIEEAMTRALMRSCPKCNKAFVKDDGCNKMTCPNCRSLSCYICRKLIPEGYAHFNQAPPHEPTTSKSSKKCPLWDGPVEARHAKEVQEAAEKAKEEYRLENPDVDDKDIHVDIPKAPPPVQRPPNAILPGAMGRLELRHHQLQQLQQHQNHLQRHRQVHMQQRQHHFDMFNDIVGQMWDPPEMPAPLPQPIAPPQPRVARAPRKKRR
ncbi:hypothetical protein L218DRAFT_861859 [Marasmius fiardii PR-910]|nr:hypothetical protein L218DRAFT_861859 [Marasmius fiardii PR-910]